jgi:hypothetical protein
MSRVSEQRAVYTSLLGLFVVAITSFCFVNCGGGAEHANSPGHHHGHQHPPHMTTDGGPPPNYITCRGTEDCLESSWYPECADPDAVTCIAPPGTATQECIFRQAYDTGCFCVERDIRNCQVGIDAGVQHCMDMGGGTTGWGGCGGI